MIITYYPDGTSSRWDANFIKSFFIGKKWRINSGVYEESGYPRTRNSYFEVVEISGDKEEVWLEHFVGE